MGTSSGFLCMRTVLCKWLNGKVFSVPCSQSLSVHFLGE